MPKKRENGTRAKLRAYFLQNVGKVLNSHELRKFVGNSSEWARRIRELRNEEGYQIKMSIPSIITGDKLSHGGSPKTTSLVVPFSSGQGDFRIEIALDTGKK